MRWAMNSININHDVLNRFSRLLKSGRMAHAYLFAGPKGIGKSQTALCVAQLVNCEKRIEGHTHEACGQCSSCLRIVSRNHPDIFFIDCGDSESIKIAQIRELMTRLQMRSFEAPTKICIIKDIETMTSDSSNALLKTLEEPAKDTLIILTTSVPEENLATVVSRCHLIKFYPLSVSALRAHLIADNQLESPVAQSLAAFSEGSLACAIELNNEGFFRRKNEIIDNVVLQENNDAYLKKILGDKPQTQAALVVLLSYFRDLLILKSGARQTQLTHPDRYDELLTLEKKYSFVRLNGIIDQIIKALALLGENLNIKIPFILLREKIWAR
jgi:DNA polymerase-3 subunit delta'